MNHCNRRWREQDGYLAMDARLFDKWHEILRIWHDEDDTGYWYIVSDELHIEHDWLTAETLEEAKEECETKFTYYLEGQIEYYQDQLNQWEETS